MDAHLKTLQKKLSIAFFSILIIYLLIAFTTSSDRPDGSSDPFLLYLAFALCIAAWSYLYYFWKTAAAKNRRPIVWIGLQILIPFGALFMYPAIIFAKVVENNPDGNLEEDEING